MQVLEENKNLNILEYKEDVHFFFYISYGDPHFWSLRTNYVHKKEQTPSGTSEE
jgi:hypothetical protein